VNRLIELTALITQWGVDRRIVQNATAFAQTRKTHEEFCELVEALARQEMSSCKTDDEKYTKEVKDAIGDIYVTLVMVCACNDTPIRMELDFAQIGGMDKGPLKFIESLIPDLIRDAVEDNTTVRITARRIVCGLMALCDLMGLDFVECVELAYSTIKDRKGTLREDGVFVKEESVSP
jgi:NTP pyrophosphatase (non-canonical NTP hydrolase)